MSNTAFDITSVPVLDEASIEAKLRNFEATEEKPVVELTKEEKERLYAEAAVIKDTMSDLKERLDFITNEFRRMDYGTEQVHSGGGKVTVGHNPVLNEARFLVAKPYDATEVVDVIKEDSKGRKRVVQETVFPNRDLYKISVDRTAAKKILGDEYADYFDEGQKKITIK